jgi:hypothetical protein
VWKRKYVFFHNIVVGVENKLVLMWHWHESTETIASFFSFMKKTQERKVRALFVRGLQFKSMGVRAVEIRHNP